jgi:hypothetical protein
VCADGVEEATSDTFERAAGEDSDIGVWITPGPWPDMADEQRVVDGRGELFDRTERLASTELVAVVKNRPPQCGADITWKCLGDAAQAADVRIAGPSETDPTRLLIRAALLGGFLGRTDYAINDLDEQPDAGPWLAAADAGLDRGRRFGATSLNDFLVQQGAADVFITTRADAARATGAQVVTPAPVARVDAVAGIAGGRVPEGAADALRAAGWGAPPGNQEDDGLPSPGVLLGLREL